MIFNNKGLKELAEALSANQKKLIISIDLGLSETELDLSAHKLTLDMIQPILKKERAIFKFAGDGFQHLARYDNGFYQLVETGEAPTIEIDGIQMHRTKKVKPFEDARQKVETVIQKSDIMLDCCGGLGYTAIWEIRMGAAKVYSCEPNPCIRYLRTENPWSKEFYTDKIDPQDSGVEEFIEKCHEGQFDCIIHDPPRFSLAGQLYSTEFYQKLANLLKSGGRLFHYTGNPYSKGRPRLFIEGIMRRLAEAGFKVKRVDEVLGVTGIKRG